MLLRWVGLMSLMSLNWDSLKDRHLRMDGWMDGPARRALLPKGSFPLTISGSLR